MKNRPRATLIYRTDTEADRRRALRRDRLCQVIILACAVALAYLLGGV